MALWSLVSFRVLYNLCTVCGEYDYVVLNRNETDKTELGKNSVLSVCLIYVLHLDAQATYQPPRPPGAGRSNLS